MKPPQNAHKKKPWKLIGICVAAVGAILAIGGGGFVLTHSGLTVDRNNLPKFVTANFVDLNRIYSISKFRSGEGHDFSGNGETCRSMKHYFTPQYDPSAEVALKANKGIPTPPDGSANDIAVYAPFDGTIAHIDEEHTPIGKQVFLTPDSSGDFMVRLFHVYVKDGITAGTKVKAGQRIGSLGKDQGTDISVQIGQMPWNEEFISVFQVMDDKVFADYQKRGVANRDDFIVSRAYRDQHPLQCKGKPDETFIYPANYDYSFDDVPLSGYNGGPQRPNQTTQNQQDSPQIDKGKPLN